MRDKINVLYYPDMVADQTTLKKAILFFDEIHFMDRPSFTFDGGMGTIGMKSPLREFEQLFRRDNVPIHIHEPLNGRLNGDLLEKISADINDLRFLSIFQEGSVNYGRFLYLIQNPKRIPGKYQCQFLSENLYQLYQHQQLTQEADQWNLIKFK